MPAGVGTLCGAPGIPSNIDGLPSLVRSQAWNGSSSPRILNDGIAYPHKHHPLESALPIQDILDSWSRR